MYNYVCVCVCVHACVCVIVINCLLILFQAPEKQRLPLLLEEYGKIRSSG